MKRHSHHKFTDIDILSKLAFKIGNRFVKFGGYVFYQSLHINGINCNPLIAGLFVYWCEELIKNYPKWERTIWIERSKCPVNK